MFETNARERFSRLWNHELDKEKKVRLWTEKENAEKEERFGEWKEEKCKFRKVEDI